MLYPSFGEVRAVVFFELNEKKRAGTALEFCILCSCCCFRLSPIYWGHPDLPIYWTELGCHNAKVEVELSSMNRKYTM
eukprot:scaffold9689_cov79-Skeletonema_dohrnii-CCMP3373.AAC.9